MQPNVARGVVLLALAGVVAGCGASRAAGGDDSARSSGAQASAPNDVPESDRGLETWPRQDPPPFPVGDFLRVAGRVDQPLSPERLAAIAAFIRWYEIDPYDIASNHWGVGVSTRAALLMWVVESPDVHVVVGTFLRDIASQRGEDPEAVGRYATVASMLGMAAHAVEHPGLEPTDPLRQAAGVESSLRWYESAVRRGAPRSPLLDDLREIRDRGELAAWIAQRVTFH